MEIKRIWWRFVVVAAILILPIVQFLLYNDYFLPRIEVGVFLGIAFCLSLVLAGTGKSRLLFDVSVLALLVVAYSPRLQNAIPFLQSAQMRWSVLILAGSLIALRYLLRERFYDVLLVFQVAIFSAGVLEIAISPKELTKRSFDTLRETDSIRSPERPSVVLHLILDAYMGPRGFAADFEPSVAAVQSTRDIFLKYGFTIHENAYSNYPFTVGTLTTLLTLNRYGGKASENAANTSALYTLLAGQGYRLNAYYTDAFNLCGKPTQMNKCVEVPANSIGNLKGAKVPWQDRLFVMAAAQADSSAAGLGAVTARLWPRYHKPMLSTFSFAEPWRLLANDLLMGADSVVHLGHFLIPHAPYVYSADGNLLPITEWDRQAGGSESEKLTDRYYVDHRRYAQQVRYLNGRLDELLGNLSEKALLDSMLIVIHGDHGSRILGFAQDPSMRRTILESHSILFAVKFPGSLVGRIVEKPAGLLTLLTETLGYLGEVPAVPDGDFIELVGGQRLSEDELATFLEYLTSRNL